MEKKNSNIVELYPDAEINMDESSSVEWAESDATIGKFEEIIDYINYYVPEECREALGGLIDQYSNMVGNDAYKCGCGLETTGEVFSFSNFKHTHDLQESVAPIMDEPISHLILYVRELGLTEEQGVTLRTLVANNVEAAFEAGHKSGVLDYRHRLAREAEKIEDIDGGPIDFDIPQDSAIEITRTEDEMKAILKVSNAIKELSLGDAVNNHLVGLLLEMQEIITKEQFLQGFEMGCKLTRVASTI